MRDEKQSENQSICEQWRPVSTVAYIHRENVQRDGWSLKEKIHCYEYMPTSTEGHTYSQDWFAPFYCKSVTNFIGYDLLAHFKVQNFTNKTKEMS